MDAPARRVLSTLLSVSFSVSSTLTSVSIWTILSTRVMHSDPIFREFSVLVWIRRGCHEPSTFYRERKCAVRQYFYISCR